MQRPTTTRLTGTQPNGDMTMTTFIGCNFTIESTEDNQFVLLGPVENQTYDTLDDLIEANPICEPAREFFFGTLSDDLDARIEDHVAQLNREGDAIAAAFAAEQEERYAAD